MAKRGQIRLNRALQSFDTSKENVKVQISGILGFVINGQYIVEVPTRPGFVYVRLRDNISEVIQAYNDGVSPVYGLPVFVSRDTIDKTRYIVTGRDTARYSNWQTSSPYIARHGNQHSFNPDTAGGGDVVWVYDRQLMPLLVYPSGSSGAGGVIIGSDTIWQQDTWRAVGGTGTPSLLGYKPTGSSAILLLVYIDENGNPQTTAGNFFANTITGTSEIIPYIPAVPNSYDIPLGAVRLVSGTSRILWDNIYDLRAIFRNATLTGTSSSGGHTIQDDGVSKTQRTNLNFVGGGFVVYDDAGNDATIVSGTASGGSTPQTPHAIPVYDDPTFKVTGSVFHFTDNISVAVTGSHAFISSTVTGSVGPAGPSGDNTLLIYDDSVFKVTGTAVVFGNNLSVVVTGSTAFVSASGGTASSHLGATASRSTTQNFNATTWTPVQWTSEDVDDNNFFSAGANTRFIIPQTGWYSFQGHIVFSANAYSRYCAFVVTGTTYGALERHAGISDERGNPVWQAKFISGQWVELWVYSSNNDSVVNGFCSILYHP